MSKLIVVVGATGYQGGSVINWFKRHEPSWKIRGMTRNPSSDAAVALASSGVEVVKADLNDLESLKSAFKGANYIFAYTDFGGIVNGPDVMGKFVAGKLAAPIGAESFKIETQQGRNIADAAATVPELERLVWSSLANANKWSGGKYTQVFHFDAKAVVADYMLQQKALDGRVSIVQMGAFVNNVFKSLELFGFRIDESNTAVWQPPFPGDLLMPWIDVEKDAGAFVKALIDAPAPTQVLAVSEWMTCKQWLDLWSETTGIKSRFEEAQLDAYTADDPSGLKLEFFQTAQFVVEFGFTGGDPDVVMPEDLEKKGFAILRTKISDYMAREDWSMLTK